MQIEYTAEALSSLIKLLNFIEEKNTQGSGERWLSRFELYLSSTLPNSLAISLCNNETFKRLNLRCLYYNDWVIAFSITNGDVLIEALLHKSRITD
jgi:hypothetical protein